jgi:hypothetical protein
MHGKPDLEDECFLQDHCLLLHQPQATDKSCCVRLLAADVAEPVSANATSSNDTTADATSSEKSLAMQHKATKPLKQPLRQQETSRQRQCSQEQQ